MGDFPSGQRGQTVNLLALPSVVRIHHPPPEKQFRRQAELFFFVQDRGVREIPGSIHDTPPNNGYRFAVSAIFFGGFAFLQKSESLLYLIDSAII